MSRLARRPERCSGSRYWFRLIAIGSGRDVAEAEAWLQAKCPHGAVTIANDLLVVSVSRHSGTLLRALVAATRDIHAAGLKVVRVEPDYLVTLSDIARRLEVSRPTVSQMRHRDVLGKSFPRPVARISSNSPVWDWADIMEWMHRNKGINVRHVVESKILREANLLMQESLVDRKATRGILKRQLTSSAI